MRSFLPVILVAAGGALGALARYGLTILNRPGWFTGTLLVNLAGCLIMGVLMRWIEVGVLKTEWRYLLGIGFLGALTTFSTFSGETLALLQSGSVLRAVLYVAASLLGCLALVTLGYLGASALWK